jgi:hypothetical protein
MECYFEELTVIQLDDSPSHVTASIRVADTTERKKSFKPLPPPVHLNDLYSSPAMPYLSQAERDYITEGVHSDLRADGRGRLDYRAMVLETGIISQANGSARVRLGEGTDVLVGVKVEIDQVEPDADNIGKIVCNVEW